MPTDLPEDMQQEAPTSIVLPPSRVRWVLTLITSLGIIALDLVLIYYQGSMVIWFMIAMFAFTAVLAVSQLMPGGGGLTLDREGFTIKIALYRRRREWTEIEPVVSNNAGMFQLVGYHIKGEPTTKPREVLPETYGLPASELARLMNHWREQAIGTAGELKP